MNHDDPVATECQSAMQKSQLPPMPLPSRFRELIALAEAGTLKKEVVQLPSGMITDLNDYVTGWAADWPGDTVHITRRLDEALAAWRKE